MFRFSPVWLHGRSTAAGVRGHGLASFRLCLRTASPVPRARAPPLCDGRREAGCPGGSRGFWESTEAAAAGLPAQTAALIDGPSPWIQGAARTQHPASLPPDPKSLAPLYSSSSNGHTFACPPAARSAAHPRSLKIRAGGPLARERTKRLPGLRGGAGPRRGLSRPGGRGLSRGGAGEVTGAPRGAQLLRLRGASRGVCEARADFPGGESSATDEGRSGLLAPGRLGRGPGAPRERGSQPAVTTGRLFHWQRCPGLF